MSSSEIAISIRGLSKAYTITHNALCRPTFRDVIMDRMRHPFKQQDRETFWALKDVNLDVKRGEVLGIIGRNGAGKSTLLKILSQITEPTAGRVELFGRVGSLLEVGTGFHPELTGRENIYLNGAILGMTRAEIRKQFDAIVEFAEIEQFLDTPVKRYSSGMYVRLAFAVAAHLNPEILVVDEVLAVGDAEFQKKCFQKVGSIANIGRTVLLVSHNMATIEALCSQGVFLKQGRLEYHGSASHAVSLYLSHTGETQPLDQRTDRIGSGELRVTQVEIRDLDGHLLQQASSGQTIDICLHYATHHHLSAKRLIVGIQLFSQQGVPIFNFHSRLRHFEFGPQLPDSGQFVCRINRLPLPASTFRLASCIMFQGGDYIDWIQDAAELSVMEGNFYGTGEVPPISHGLCLVDADWRVAEIPA